MDPLSTMGATGGEVNKHTAVPQNSLAEVGGPGNRETPSRWVWISFYLDTIDPNNFVKPKVNDS